LKITAVSEKKPIF